MIKTKDLTYSYSESKKLSFSNITIEEGQQFLLKGKSGSGKTTLIHLLTGMLSPSSGTIEINDTDVAQLRASEMDRFRAKNIGLIFQQNLFINSLSMIENIEVPLSMAGTHFDKKHVNNLLKQLDIEGLAHKKPNQLSQGEKQRFTIARALANKPTFVIADEPTSSLDDENCLNFLNLIQQNCQEYDATLLIATHDSRLETQFTNIIHL